MSERENDVPEQHNDETCEQRPSEQPQREQSPAPADPASSGADAADAPAADAAPAPKNPRRRRVVAVAVGAIVVIAVAAGVLAGFMTGALHPGGAAAKYDLLSYVEESDVTDYIETYKSQMGYGDASDEDWASFLAAYNMTPERLRASTIDQLMTDQIVEDKCTKLGISVSDDELDQAIEYYKNLYGSGSDDIWQQTLAQYGQTEEGFRDNQRLSMLKEKLAEDQVAQPTPSDDDVKSTIASYIDNANANGTSLTLKHSYCFMKKKSSSEGSLAEREQVEKIRDELVKVGASEESFASAVDLYSDDSDELKEKAGANGWNADTSGYGEEYVKALDNTGKGGVSSVFADDDYYYFIWVSDTYTLPAKSAKASKIDLSQMPDALHQYFSDVAAYAQWQQQAKEYLANITSDVSVVYFDMPQDVPYNVDMSKAQTTDADSGSADSGSDDNDGSADGGEDSQQSAEE